MPATNEMATLIASDAEASGPTDQVDKLLFQFLDNEARIKHLEEQLETATAKRTQLQLEQIPAAMDQARKKKIDYKDGSQLSLQPFLAAELPSVSKIMETKDEEKRIELESRRLQGFNWLRDNNGASIIKNELRIEIPKGKDNLVARLTAMADEDGLTWSRGEEVHHMTLKSFLKEKLRAGAKIPVDVFRLVTGQKAHYKAPKSSKEREE